jgi:hypothetical protein
MQQQISSNKGLDAFLVKPVNPAIALEILDEKFKKKITIWFGNRTGL